LYLITVGFAGNGGRISPRNMRTDNDQKRKGDVIVAKKQKEFATDKHPEKELEPLVLETDQTKPEDAKRQN